MGLTISAIHFRHPNAIPVYSTTLSGKPGDKFRQDGRKGWNFRMFVGNASIQTAQLHPPPPFTFGDKIYKELFKFLKRRTKQERENVGNFCRFSGKCQNKGIQEFWTSFKDARGLSSFILEALKYSEALYYEEIRAFVIHAQEAPSFSSANSSIIE